MPERIYETNEYILNRYVVQKILGAGAFRVCIKSWIH